jgi:nickel transport system substrate-binding protein
MKIFSATSVLALMIASRRSVMAQAPDNCMAHDLIFIVKEGASQMIAVEDDIRRDLEKIGITLETIFANSTEYSNYETSGEYNLLFTNTWGAPYDPHS